MDASQVLSMNNIVATLSGVSQIKGTLSPVALPVMSGKVYPTQTLNVYDEDYEVQGSLTENITLPTGNKIMKDDLTILKVGMTEVSNESGGYTICIGG